MLKGSIGGYASVSGSLLGFKKEAKYELEFASWNGVTITKGTIMSCDVCDTSGDNCPFYKWKIETDCSKVSKCTLKKEEACSKCA